MPPTIKKILFLILLAGTLHVTLPAQTKVQVVTRSVVKLFEYKSGVSLEIKGEKATILIKPSVDNTIKVKLSLISKNPSKAVAEEDLQYCVYKIDERSGRIEISNSFANSNAYKEITSNLSTKYELEVPAGIILNINNIYGNAELSNLTGNISIASSFGQVSFTNISGAITIISNYSDIEGNGLNGQGNINAQQAEISLLNINNTCTIRNKFGTIAIEGVNAPVNIAAEMTRINVSLGDLKRYSLNFETQNDKILVSEALRKLVSQKSGKTYFAYTNGTISIKAKTTYNTITLKTN